MNPIKVEMEWEDTRNFPVGRVYRVEDTTYTEEVVILNITDEYIIFISKEKLVKQISYDKVKQIKFIKWG